MRMFTGIATGAVLWMCLAASLGAQTCVEGNCRDGKGVMTYPEGNKYEGEFKNGRHDGQGTMKYSNGDEYAGEFRNGKRDGKGELVSSSGHRYVGTFKDDMRHGEGTITYPNGTVYTGGLKAGKLQGQGKTTFFDGTVYVGEYSNGKFDGKGRMTQPRNGTYVGDFKEGKRDGQGEWKDDSGNSYSGSYRNNLREGRGTAAYSNGAKYTGEFKSDRPDGEGTMTYADGNIYVGKFDMGDTTQGTLTYANGTVYTGEMKRHRPNGQGAMSGKDGSNYVGGFKEGAPEGQVTFTMPNGSVLTGEFSKGRPEGRCVVQYKDGGRYEGDFKAGKRDGKGTLVLPGGETYTGQFKDDRPDGTGVLSRQDGTKYSGQFRKGAPVEQDELAGIRNGGEIPGFARNDLKSVYDDFSESHKKELILAGLREKPVEKRTYPSETIYHHTFIYMKKDGGMMKYSDRAIKINSSSAKNSLGEQKIYYDSSREKVEFLKAASYSADGGEVETDLNSVIVKEPYTGLVYSDLKMKIITLKGVGDGSAIRVAKAEAQKKGMDKDFIFEEFYLDSYEPLGERIIVVRIEAGTPIRRSERIRESIPELQQDHYTLKNGDSIHIYKMIKRRVKDYEMYSIPFYEYANKASFRTSEGWEDIGKWYYSVSKDRMAADREIREKTSELVKGRSSRDERIKALYDYVKDMRYVSISLNQYRLIPHSAGETFKNKYGDCKDKATLLIAMLRSIEVNAYIALTYTNSLVDSSLPTPLAFNHAIVAIPDGKGSYIFLDPTSKTPYGFLASYIQYRNALIAKEDGGELVLIPVEDSDKKKEETVGRIDLRDFGAVRVNLESVLRGESDLDDMVRNIPEKRLKEFLQVTFSEACRPMTIQINSVELDKRKSDVEYTLRIDMTVRGFLTIMGNYYAFSPLKIFQRGSYALLISKERNTDIELREPSRYTTEVTIDIPEKTTIEFVPPGTSKTNEKFGEYRYTINSTDKTIKIKTLHDLKKKRISAVDFNEFREFMTSWQDQENQNILLRKRP